MTDSGDVIKVLARLATLPMALQPDRRIFVVEAVPDEAKAPFVEFYRQTREADEAAHKWAEDHGFEGFYRPSQSWGGAPRPPLVFAFKGDKKPSAAWVYAPSHFRCNPGHIAVCPSQKAAGKEVSAELDALPKFPQYFSAYASLGVIDTLQTAKGFSTVGTSEGKMRWAAPASIDGRYFVQVPNHNYDIAAAAKRAADYIEQGKLTWVPDLNYIGDPISWRPPAGWNLLTEAQFDLIIAQAQIKLDEQRAASVGSD